MVGNAAQRAYDLEIVTDVGRIGLMIAPDTDKKKRWPGALAPSTSSEQFQRQDVERLWSDTNAGGGYSLATPQASNGYSFGLSVETRYGCVMPGGARTSVNIGALSGDFGPILTAYRNPVTGTDLYFVAGVLVIKIPGGYQDPVIETNLLGALNAHGGSIDDWIAQSSTEHLGKIYIGGYRTNDYPRPIISYDGSGSLGYLASNVAFPADRGDGWMLKGNVYQDGLDGVGSERLFASIAGGTSYKYLTGTADPLQGSNWTPASGTAGTFGDRVGSSSFPIRAWAATGQRAWAVKSDGVFEAQRAGTRIVNIAPYDVSLPSADTAADHLANGSHVMEGALYVSDGVRGIDRLTGLDGRRNDSSERIGYGYGLPYDGPVGGRDEVLFDVGDGWLGVIKYNRSNRTSYICWWRPQSAVLGASGSQAYGWHGSWAELPADRKATLALADAPFGNPRLWVASVGTGADNDGVVYLDWFSLPRDGNPLNDLLHGGPHRFATSGSIDFPADPYGRASALKSPRRVSVVGRGLSQSSYLQVGLSADGGAFADVGVPINADPYLTMRLSNPRSARYLQPRVSLTGTATAPPRLYELALRNGWYVEPYAVRQLRVEFGSGVPLNNGGYTDDNPAEVWNALVAQMGAAATGTGLTTLFDWDDEEHEVQIEQSLSWLDEKRLDPRGSIWTAVLTITTLHRVARYGDGSRYGTGIEW